MSPVNVRVNDPLINRCETVLTHSCVGTNPFRPTAVAVTRSKLLSVSNDRDRRSGILPLAFSDTADGKLEGVACSMVGDTSSCGVAISSNWGESRGTTRISVRLSTDCSLLKIPREFSRSSIFCFSSCGWSYTSSPARLLPLVSGARDCSSFAR